METDIERWLSFAGRVETALKTMSREIYSDGYIDNISNLLRELRSEAAIVKSSGPIERQACYFRANSLAQKLRNTAHFADHG